jgi:hypothetical protein
MNATNRTALRNVGILFVVIGILSLMNKERYTSGRNDHRYAFVDTNPSRRVSGFFDNCSPENMEDCSRNNPYEGLPLP